MSISQRFKNQLNEVWSKIERFTGTEFDFNPLNSDLIVDTPLTIYVSPNGDDGNPGTELLPVKTLAGAEQRIPSKNIQSLVTIKLDSGSYKAHIFSGYNLNPDSSGSLCGLVIRGSYSQVTSLSQGVASGLVTSATNGSASNNTFATLTDSLNNWQVNELTGLFVQITSGSSAIGQFFPIISNTATEITIAATSWTVPIAGDGYSIVDITSAIDSACQISPTLALDGRTQGAASNIGLAFVNINGISTRVGVRCEYIKYNIANVVGATVTGGICDVNFNRCSFVNSALSTSGPAPITISAAVFKMTASGTACTFGSSARGSGPITLSNAVMLSVSGGGGFAISLQPNTTLSLSSTHISDPFLSTNGWNSGIVLSTGARLTMSGGIKILNCTSRGIRAEDANDGCTGSVTTISGGLEVGSNIVGSNLTAFSISGPQLITVTTSTGKIFGSGSSILFNLSKGARLNLTAASTATGATEILLDGVANTIATMRAASPKLLKNDYGTIIYE